MNSLRIACLNSSCYRTLFPAMAERFEGYCIECFAEILNERRRPPQKPEVYWGISDPVDLLLIWIKNRDKTETPFVPLHMFESLNAQQLSRLVLANVYLIRAKSYEVASALSLFLGALTKAELSQVCHVWLNQSDYECWPPMIFRNATTEVRDRLIQQTLLEESPRLDLFAWIGDEVSLQQMLAWCKQPLPKWRDIVVPRVEHIGLHAFWELREGRRRNLYLDTCMALIPRGSPDYPQYVVNSLDCEKPRLLIELPMPCPLCGDALVHLFEIPTRDPVFEFLGYPGEIPILACKRCAAFTSNPIFASLDEQGVPHWHQANDLSVGKHALGWEADAEQWQGADFIVVPREAHRAADWTVEIITFSQIGGIPTEIGGIRFAECPDCREQMVFVAQLAREDFQGSEGIFHASFCAKCSVTAVCYEQS